MIIDWLISAHKYQCFNARAVVVVEVVVVVVVLTVLLNFYFFVVNVFRYLRVRIIQQLTNVAGMMGH
jgi:hypothetical protein